MTKETQTTIDYVQKTRKIKYEKVLFMKRNRCDAVTKYLSLEVHLYPIIQFVHYKIIVIELWIFISSAVGSFRRWHFSIVHA